MNVSRREAVEMLVEADRSSQAVESRAPKEHLAFIGWALFNAVVIPGFDVFDRAVWGWTTIAIAVAGFVATLTYYVRRSMQVEVKQRSPWWMWPAMGLWGALAGLLAWGLDGKLAFSYACGLRGCRPDVGLGSTPAEKGVSHPRTRLDDLIHHPVRFSLMAALAKAEELEFRFLCDALGVSDSVLSRQASSLEEAGYVTIRKGFVGKRPRTWLSLSALGRKTFEVHVHALREIAG